MYVIDEKEEARLKQIAFEKYMAEKAIEAKEIAREQALKEKKQKMLVQKEAARHAKAQATQKKIMSGKQTIEGVKVEVDAQRIDLLEGSSIELIDRS